MVIDLRLCDGCALCTISCQQRHGLREEQTWIKVYSMKDASGGTFSMPMPCMMCENPPCMYVCPVGSTFRTDEGLVLVDPDTCIGSRACMAACPYQARYFNWTDPPPVKRMPLPPTPQMPVPQQKGTVGKCVLCADRLPHGELPECVNGCPMGVLYIGDLVSDVAVNGLGTTVVLSEFLHANDAIRYKEELGTNPRVYYMLGGQDLGVRHDGTAQASPPFGKPSLLWWLAIFALGMVILAGGAAWVVSSGSGWGGRLQRPGVLGHLHRPIVTFIGVSYGRAVVSAILRLTGASWRARSYGWRGHSRRLR
jgi:molybdopterin-containing oxidoreductase family iron-sulfur binding subunit